MTVRAYDPKCHELAVAFLEELELSDRDLAQRAHELAQEIQNTIEDFFSGMRLDASADARNEAAYERQQQSLMESGGPDDSSYRRDMINAGRGHLLKG
jgi:hypothetical protein